MMKNDKKETKTTEKKEASRNSVMTKKVTARFMTVVFISIIVFCVALVTTLSVLTIMRLSKNAQLKNQADAIVEKYNIEATQHNNKSDPDYAEVYFEGNVMYIPSENIIIEYQP